jgi:16S rRNA (cytosine967-C5)-methyltransferase
MNRRFSRPFPDPFLPQPSRHVGERAGLPSVAADLIEETGPDRPADRVLRDALRGPLKLAPDSASRLARLFFSFFRWRGWLSPAMPLEEQVREADGLAQRFAAEPGSFSDAELRSRAVPPWVRDFLPVTDTWVRSLQGEPVLWVRARPGRGAELASRLGDCEPAGEGWLADALRYHGSTDLFRTPEFQTGTFQIQDLHSQAVGWLCAPRPGETWWDACAGEGGKLLHLSDLMTNRGLIWASDPAEWRLHKLKLRARRAGAFNYRTAAWDGSERLPTKTRFDGILVDAPCSNVGTWQRNPHARWTTTPKDVQELAALQSRLLEHAAQALKPGGRLVYAVCTLTAPETTGVADRFERAHPAFTPETLPDPFAADPQSPRHRLEPGARGGNGMFVAAWRRSA